LVEPSGAVRISTSAVVAPGGKSLAEKGRVTVTGVVKVVPSGPKMYVVPTAVSVVSAAGAAAGWMVISVPFPSAPDGTAMETPELLDTEPPVVPIVLLVTAVFAPHPNDNDNATHATHSARAFKGVPLREMVFRAIIVK
jgi:hypothetical protein